MNRVDHLSYSALVTFLRNQVEFQKRYIAKVYDNPSSPSMVVGKAFHKALEIYYKGGTFDEAAAAGLDEINSTSDYEIDYGKTGSREKMIKEFNDSLNIYFEEAPKFEVLDAEKRLEAEISKVPMVGIIDLIIKGSSEDKIKLKDYKTVSFYSSATNDPLDPEYQENYKYLLQGSIYLVLAEKVLKKEIESVGFIEIKKTKNRDGSPQIREFEYSRNDLLEFLPTTEKLITNVFDYVNNDNAKFFPNPSDILNGQESMEVLANIETGFDKAKIKRKMNVAEKFSEKNTTVDLLETDGETNENLIIKKFLEFGIGGAIGETFTGASVIRYTFRPNRGVAMKNIGSRADDLAIALQAKSVRVLAPIYGTNLIGVEIPNPERKVLNFDDSLLRKGTFEIPLGQDIFGENHYGDLTKMPHLLIAGQTGSGKSVMLNVILESLTKQLSTDELKLVLIDPKQVELGFYEDSKHLLKPIVTNPIHAQETLADLVEKMESRYKTLRKAGVRKIEDYKGEMPRIVCVIDEFADLMMTSGNKREEFKLNIKGMIETILHFNKDFDLSEVKSLEDLKINPKMSEFEKETIKEQKKAMKELEKAILEASDLGIPSAESSIIRIAQKARAVGIHLILATQRPSTDVVTGLIKANIPTKIAFSVTNSLNSKIILDETGAEMLTGNGDMLYQDPRANHLERLQGFYL